MNKLLSLAATLFVVGAASAAPVVQADISDFTWDGDYATKSLETILTTKVDADFYINYQIVAFETFIAENANCMMIEEIAGNAKNNTFGWYDVNNDAVLNEIFPGSATDPASKFVVFAPATEVGFYLDPQGFQPGVGIFRSESGKNLGGAGQVAVYQSISDENEYILAWEDLTRSNLDNEYRDPALYTDSDFNDMVVRVNVNVPEPATLGFIGLSLLSLSGLSFFRRKRN